MTHTYTFTREPLTEDAPYLYYVRAVHNGKDEAHLNLFDSALRGHNKDRLERWLGHDAMAALLLHGTPAIVERGDPITF